MSPSGALDVSDGQVVRPSAPTDPAVARSLAVIRAQLAEAVAAPKCHPCGCLRATVEALARTEPGRGELATSLASARAVFAPTRYDCLGCPVCFPAIAANAFADAFPNEADGLDTCPTEAPSERTGWPPLPGDYAVLRHGAPVAVCALRSVELVAALKAAPPAGLSIVGTLHTENLGIERLIRNVLANPNLRFLILCGEDTEQAVGHLPGQSLASLLRDGLDARGRIVGAKGKRPVLKNVTAAQVQRFRRQVELLDLVGETSIARITAAIRDLAARDPGPFGETVADAAVAPVMVSEPKRLVLDPAGYFVVYPDAARQTLVLEHYTNAGVLDCVLEGRTPTSLYGEVVARALVSRLEHAAYLGAELARAERSLQTGEAYVQDRAGGEVDAPLDALGEPTKGEPSCGCAGGCGGGR